MSTASASSVNLNRPSLPCSSSQKVPEGFEAQADLMIKKLRKATNFVDVPEGYKPMCLKSCNYLWKDHKSKTKSNYFVPNKSNPELSSMVPPNIIADQWTVLVAYWNTEDAKAIATRNSINRETRGPSQNTGRKNFAQLRYEMEQSGEESDKFSVWKKARKKSNPEVAQVINEYNRKLLLVRPVEDQKLTAVKDRVFHDVIGEDGHGYCRTYGSNVPRNLVYPQEPLETASSNDLIAKITEEVTEKLKESFDKKLEDTIKMLQAQIANNMDCTIAQGGETQLHMDWYQLMQQVAMRLGGSP